MNKNDTVSQPQKPPVRPALTIKSKVKAGKTSIQHNETSTRRR